MATGKARERQTAIVTGASSGIGLGIAKAFLDRGDNVVINARNEDRLQSVARDLGDESRIAVVAGDIGMKQTSEILVSTALERFGRVDALVNNGGHFFPKPFSEYTEEDLDQFLQTHLKGNYFASQVVAVPMEQQGGGSITNITTVLALRGVTAIPSSAPVSAKGAVNALTRSLAIELAPKRIRVNAIAPGIIKTPIHGRSDDQFEELNGMQPLGHVGEVQDIVDAVLYLTDANFVTGVVLPVDGGVAAGGA